MIVACSFKPLEFDGFKWGGAAPLTVWDYGRLNFVIVVKASKGLVEAVVGFCPGIAGYPVHPLPRRWLLRRLA